MRPVVWHPGWCWRSAFGLNLRSLLSLACVASRVVPGLSCWTVVGQKGQSTVRMKLLSSHEGPVTLMCTHQGVQPLDACHGTSCKLI